MGKPATGFPALVSRPIEGVYVGTHTLSKQAERLERVSRRFGERIVHWLNRTEADKTLPSPEVVEVFRYWQAAILGLLKEQRERAKVKSGEEVTDEQLSAQFREEMAKALESFTPKEREFAIELWSRMTPSGKPAKATEEVQ